MANEIIHEPVIPSPIENATVTKGIVNGVHRNYRITPNEGYVLHDKGLDANVLDEDGNETGEIELGYRTSTASCPANYDFEANPNEYYTVLASTVPENQIHGAVNTPEIA